MNSRGEVGFRLARYDRARELVIDPVLVYSNYLGGHPSDAAIALGVDAQGFVYATGYTTATDFLVTDRAVKSAAVGERDIFVVKIDPNAPVDVSVVYSTYLGGTGIDTPKAMVVDGAGNVYITGTTASTDFPTAGSGYQTTLVGKSDAFVTLLDTNGTGTEGLVYSTYLGGTGDQTANAMAVSPQGLVYITGGTSSTDFPQLGASYQGSNAGSADAFIAVFDPSQPQASSLVYTTYFGGEGRETGTAIAVDSEGAILVAGFTTGVVPLGPNPIQSENRGFGDGFVAKLNPALGAGAALVYSTLLGGTDLDQPTRILVDRTGGIIVTGFTLSSDFPTTSNALQTTYGGNADAFITRLDPAKPAAEALTYSTFLGGGNADVVYDAILDPQGALYLTGYTMSNDFPIAGNPYQASRIATADAFVTRLDVSRPGAEGLLWSTFLGSAGVDVGYGIVLDLRGRICVAGITTSAAFPQGNPLVRSSQSGGIGPFVVVLDSCDCTNPNADAACGCSTPAANPE